MEMEAIAVLPEDGIAKVLGVLPPRSVAVARCVCKAWRDIIDTRSLLHRHLLPHSVRGAFVNYIDHMRPHLFSRPSTSSSFPRIDGLLSFLPNDQKRDWWSVLDHCNGLVLCNVKWESKLLVCNPATHRWTLLPVQNSHYAGAYYLAFDPVVSPDYEVFLIPDVPEKPKPAKPIYYQKAEHDPDAPFCLDWLFSLPEGALSVEDQMAEEDQQDVEEHPSSMDNKNNGPDHDDDPCRLMEWPPSPWSLKVFSSRSGQWEDRSFLREGQPVGTVEDMRLDNEEPTWQGPRQRYAVYHNGGLYVHCRGSFVARFPLSYDKYQVIKMPTETKDVKSYLGRSNDTVFFGTVDDRKLLVWMLNESCGHMEWILKYEVYIGLYANYVGSLPYNNGRQPDGSWMVEENNYKSYSDHNNAESESEESADCDSGSDDDIETKSNESIEWDSDNDDIFTVEAGANEERLDTFCILGFHPFKEVVFLVEWFGVARYHLNSSKIQYLGNSRPRCYYRNHTNGIYESFMYTPCMIGNLIHGDDSGDEL